MNINLLFGTEISSAHPQFRRFMGTPAEGWVSLIVFQQKRDARKSSSGRFPTRDL
jgi:hypothetical protein